MSCSLSFLTQFFANPECGPEYHLEVPLEIPFKVLLKYPREIPFFKCHPECYLEYHPECGPEYHPDFQDQSHRVYGTKDLAGPFLRNCILKFFTM